MDRATQPARSAVAEHSHGGKKPIAAVASVVRADQAAATSPFLASGHLDPRRGNAVSRGGGLRLAPFGDEVVPPASGCPDRRRASDVSRGDGQRLATLGDDVPRVAGIDAA